MLGKKIISAIVTFLFDHPRIARALGIFLNSIALVLGIVLLPISLFIEFVRKIAEKLNNNNKLE